MLRPGATCLVFGVVVMFGAAPEAARAQAAPRRLGPKGPPPTAREVRPAETGGGRDEGRQSRDEDEGREPRDESTAQLRALRLFVSRGSAGQGDLSGMTSLLQGNAALQEELGLTDRQKGELKAASKAIRRRQDELLRKMPAGGGGSGGDQARAEIVQAGEGDEEFDPGAMREAIGALGRESDESVLRALSPRQRERLSQIALRIEGPTAVARPEVASRLNLSPDQQARVAAIVDRMGADQQRRLIAQMERPRPSPAGSAPAAPGPRAAAKGPAPAVGDAGGEEAAGAETQRAGDEQDRALKAAEAQVAGVLTPRQKKVFNRLLGPDFDLTLLVRPPRGAGEDRR
jgi:hypothetical protein